MAAPTVSSWSLPLVLLPIVLLFVCATSTPNSRLLNERFVLLERELLALTKLLLRWQDLANNENLPFYVSNLTHINSFLEEVETSNDGRPENEKFLSQHPMGVFVITKRLSQTWPEIIQLIRHHKHNDGAFALKLASLENFLPDEKDVKIAGESVLEIQRIYDVATETFTNDLHSLSTRFTAPVVFDLAEISQELGHSYYAIQWYEQAMKECAILKEATAHKLKVRALARIASVYYKLRHLDKAIELAQKVLHEEPYSEMASNDVHFYQRLQREGTVDDAQSIAPRQRSQAKQKLTEDVCAGKVNKSDGLNPCYYHYINALWRVPTEIVRNSPRIILYHNFINVNVTRSLKNGIEFKIEETMDSDLTYKKHRWAHVTDANAYVRQINRLFTSLTHIDWSLTKSPFMAISHGVGASNDNNMVDLKSIHEHGQNTSTFMIFLDDVDAGGELVFPYLKTTVKPSKGSVVFWHNTNVDGQLNQKLQWGECPIIKGSKLVMYKIYRDYVNVRKHAKDER